MKTRPIAASTAASPIRSVVESMKAPNGVPFPVARASAPSRMSSTEPTMNTAAPSQKKSSSSWSSSQTSTAAARQRVTPAAVSLFGVIHESARPPISREAAPRAPFV